MDGVYFDKVMKEVEASQIKMAELPQGNLTKRHHPR
jgi:hypothetical protein